MTEPLHHQQPDDEHPASDDKRPEELRPTPAQNGATPEPLDPLNNLERLRVSQNSAAMTTVKAVITTVSVRKPNRHEFVRTRPGDEWRFDAYGLVDKSDRNETYLVDPVLCPALFSEVQPVLLVLTTSRTSPLPFLWPCRLPGPDGRSNRWYESAREAVKEAESHWVRVVSDMAAGCYVPYIAEGRLPEPEWPELTMHDLMRLAFRDRFIRDLSHPVLKRLRGEV